MTWEIEIENVAGILDGRATIEPGPNAVRASNWQGKSSFVEAVKAGLGVPSTLTEGRDEGRVRLSTPDRERVVDLVREDGATRVRGDPLLAGEYDTVRAELFACLDETNEVRRRVRRGEDLEAALLRPLDFENIERRIADLKRERERVVSELAGAREAKKRLPSIAEKVTRLESELSDLRERHRELTGGDGDADAAGSARSELGSARAERDEAENRVEQLAASIERTETKLAEKREALGEVEVEVDEDVGAKLQAARDDLADLRGDVEVLQSVHSATEMVLSGDNLDLLTDVRRELTGDAVVCWTCGSEVGRDRIEAQLDELGEQIASRRGKIESLRDEVERLEARRETVKEARRRKRDLEAEVADLEDRLADHRDDLEAARRRLADARERVEALSDSVEETVQAVTDVESEIKYREAELADARDEYESLQSRAERVETLAGERERLDDEIETLRGRKDEIERGTRVAFDDAMGEILDRFDTGFETARLTPGFDLVVARDGREASLDALSEGELELLGFVAALAGFEAFDVAETVPIMLVDGVGGLAEENLQTLISYLRDRTEYLVFTVYPEYAPVEGHEIDPGDWTTASATAPE